MSRLSQMLAHEQKQRGLNERQIADEYGWKQQSFSQWKTGTIPRAAWYGKLSEFLRISTDMVEELVAEAKASTGNTKLPKKLDLVRAFPRGKVADRRTGKYRFDDIPTARYSIMIDTKVMEPALPVGTKAWLDPGIWAKPGNEVMVYGRSGNAWLGRLIGHEVERADIENATGRLTIKDVEAVHLIVLSERIPTAE